jgi:hypothetical protein
VGFRAMFKPKTGVITNSFVFVQVMV